MTSCPSCSSEILETGRFCPSCGAQVRSSGAISEDAPTILRAPTPSRTSGVRSGVRGLSSSSSSVDHGRFTPGEMVADRYRIIEQVGKGGMGEVYRADDLKLEQQVALKFLPPAFENDPERLTRFLGEVRIARQISHANVCRVYDIGDVNGQHFLTMEYVDGEDLASLLKRIGRIASEKATEIARQVCAGLAAAHDKGILHRDLKPGNVMLDRKGKVRITDFGLAALAEDIRGLEIRVGTPAYMAPEQLAGKEVSVRSDLYALGLILYELYTGKPAYDASSLAELRKMQSETAPASVGSVVPEIDPAVERVIERCLETDPALRPASALAVAAALPGGDPLAAALAAGETPSPEMVAAAGREGGLRPVVAWAALGLFVASLAGHVLVTRKDELIHRVPFTKSPEVLTARAHEILRRLGYPDPPVDSARFLGVDREYLDYLAEHDTTPGRWDELAHGRPASIALIYRESPRKMKPLNRTGIVQESDPPPTTSGMTSVQVDTAGRLVYLSRVPPQMEEAQGSDPEPDWKALFDEAGLDLASFTPAASTWNPPAYADRKAAWQGTYPDEPDLPVRIEAASYRGKPVYFEILHPWSRPQRMQAETIPTGIRVGTFLSVLFALSAIVGAIYAARRNLRLGRGDRRGALRFALAVLMGSLAIWALSANHIASLGEEWTIFVAALGRSLYPASITWLLYVALEPMIRRNWPESMVTWTRLLAGRFDDAMVGRDILYGALLGTVLSLAAGLVRVAPGFFGMLTPRPSVGALDALLGTTHLVKQLLVAALNSTLSAIFLLFFMTSGLILSRKRWKPTVAIFFGITVLFQFLFNPTGSLARDALGAVIIAAGLTLAIVRLGLVALIVTILFLSWNVPVPGAASAWYNATASTALVIGVALALYGFYRSLAGAPLFGRKLVED